MTTISRDSIAEGGTVRVEVNGKFVCVAKVGEQIFAVADTCSHSEASLSEGSISGFKIECWLHGAEFDLRSGVALTLPAVETLETFVVTADGANVIITEEK